MDSKHNLRFSIVTSENSQKVEYFVKNLLNLVRLFSSTKVLMFS